VTDSSNRMTKSQVKAAILEHEASEFGPDALTGQEVDKFFRSNKCFDLWFDYDDKLFAYGFLTLRKGIYRLDRLCVTLEGRNIPYLGTYIHNALIGDNREYAIQCFVPERFVSTQYWMSRHGWVAVGIVKDYYHSGDAIEFMRQNHNEEVPDQDTSTS